MVEHAGVVGSENTRGQIIGVTGVEIIMADNELLNDNDVDGGDDDIFVYTGQGNNEVPRDVKRVRIAENIDTIPRWTFYQCRQLIEVEGHNKLKKIEQWAFHSCHPLRRVTKMQGVVEIEVGAFENCTALSDIDFDKLEIIGNGAFGHCNCLRSINLPSIRRVGRYAFLRCHALTDALFGVKLERIVDNSFLGCRVLRRITIPLKDNLIIDCTAFNQCENLSRVDTLAGEIDKTISTLHMESWRVEMKEEIDRINQTLPNI